MAFYPEFDGKILVATGGASLIVEALARQFVANGGSVVLGDLTTDHAQDVLSDVGDAGRFVRTKPHIGLTDADAERMATILLAAPKEDSPPIPGRSTMEN